MEKIYNLDSTTENIFFSKLTEKELMVLLKELNNIKFIYRKNLNLPKDSTFGIEIEYETALDSIVRDDIKNSITKAWKVKSEMNISRYNQDETYYGGEVISPILYDEDKTWQSLLHICNILQNNDAVITEFTGGHIHVGAHAIKQNYTGFINLMKLWAIYEDIIYRFSANGEKIRYISYKCALPIRDKVFSALKSEIKDEDKINIQTLIENKFMFTRLKKTSGIETRNIKSQEFKEKNTIEFRCPNGTLNPKIWQNNINFFIKFLYYSQSNLLDEDKLNWDFEKLKNKESNLHTYNNLRFEDSLILADKIFDNNLEKSLFLYQYLKLFKPTEKEQPILKKK